MPVGERVRIHLFVVGVLLQLQSHSGELGPREFDAQLLPDRAPPSTNREGDDKLSEDDQDSTPQYYDPDVSHGSSPSLRWVLRVPLALPPRF